MRKCFGIVVRFTDSDKVFQVKQLFKTEKEAIKFVGESELFRNAHAVAEFRRCFVSD